MIWRAPPAAGALPVTCWIGGSHTTEGRPTPLGRIVLAPRRRRASTRMYLSSAHPDGKHCSPMASGLTLRLNVLNLF